MKLSPRYHARETAVKRAQIERAKVILGSATPPLWKHITERKKGEYTLFTLEKRAKESVLPRVHTVDMRKELKEGNRSILSRQLRDMIQQRLDKKQQTMLFLNRRGYSGFLSCRACGKPIRCPHCDVSLSVHSSGRMICHYCGYETEKPATCPQCGSAFLRGFRVGTQQVEELVRNEFPKARILRMDMDTTREKDGHEKILSAFCKSGSGHSGGNPDDCERP